jgi:Trk K+ transport system NAD-binding subunit
VKLLVIGCGRVGSTIAKRFAAEGWDVTAIDEKESALNRLGEDWTGGFVVGHGMDTAVLRQAGIEDADSVVVSTDGDNTNLVIGRAEAVRDRLHRGADPRPRARGLLSRARHAHGLSYIHCN